MALRHKTLSDTEHDQYAWWTSLKHGGLLLSPSKIGASERLTTHIEPLTAAVDAQLRRQVVRVLEDRRSGAAGLLDVVLESVCGLGIAGAPKESAGQWIRGARVGEEWSRKSMTGEIIRPQRVWQGMHAAALPVFVDTRAQRLGIGESRRFLAKITEWLRGTRHRLALATNGVQWRLIYAGLDYEAFAEWDVNLWFEEGRPSPQVDALRILLNPEILTPSSEGNLSPLLDAIEASHRGQAEVSAELGERVRRAVETLIDDLSPVLGNLDAKVRPQDVYRAATRIVMRMVVVLFAEARDLLPRSIAAYHDSYGINGLRETLERAGGGEGEDRLRSRSPSAWPRLLSLFRLVYYGSPHESLEIRRYAGDLFRPGHEGSDDPVSAALHVMENAVDEVSDRTVYRMLELLCRTRTRVRQGRAWTLVETPVDFSDLGSEYIGMLYEGLLDYELRQAGDDPVVFLNLGDQPALPISKLESLDDAGIARLLEKAKQRSAKATSEEDGSGDDAGDEEPSDEGEDESQDAESPEEADAESVPAEGLLTDSVTDDSTRTSEADERRAAKDRVRAWALRAVKVGNVVPKPRTRNASALAQHENACEAAADKLYSRIVLPGEWYLVRWGGTRKGSGTFYTRRELAVPTVRRTLEPLVYEMGEGDRTQAEASTKSERTVRRPDQILSLKVCDPACGSGSFLVAALDYLTDALVESLYVHGMIPDRDAENKAVALPSCTNVGDNLAADLIPCLPSDPDFDRRLRARLMRHVVERCIYGVDLDPLAVELARVALWVRTMDRDLPFTFLDHKVKVGNSLVGCWLDRLQDYPVLAWSREGGDKDYSGVHYAKDSWTKALRAFRNEKVKNEMRAWLQTPEGQGTLTGPEVFESIHRDLATTLERIHSLAVSDPEDAEEEYRANVLGHPLLTQLRKSMDKWCAIWFWPAEEAANAPSPMDITGDEQRHAVADQIAREHRFFHWEVEFPDVFNAARTGFDAVIGNPPWDVQKPNSKEYFSNIDPLYRSYGKQEALQKQKEYFRSDRAIERGWLLYRAGFKALSNWVKHAGSPFGNGDDNDDRFNLGAGSADFHRFWSQRRHARKGYADPVHPFIHQGSADINTYKMFLEQSHAILRPGGRLGMIVPSGIYTDKGTTAMRNLFLNACRWEWLFGFENREKIFDIDSRFKFCPVLVEKGGKTEKIQTAFMRRNLADWDRAEDNALPYSVERVRRFSPSTHAILELRNRKDMEILDKIYSNSVLLGDDSPDGWGIQYSREFDMTMDSKLFPPRPVWEAQGYRPDEYGRWLKGKWREKALNRARWEIEPGIILSRDGEAWIKETEIEDVALPLYEGRMVGQFDFSQKGWVRGKGRGAQWNDILWGDKSIQPQYLMAESRSGRLFVDPHSLKVPIMNIGSATNTRTVIGAVIAGFPCNHSLNPIRTRTADEALLLCALIDSFVYDFTVRLRLGGLNLSFFVLNDTPVPSPGSDAGSSVCRVASRLSLPGNLFSPVWLRGRDGFVWRQRWAMTESERLRCRTMLDAMVAEMYGLGWDDLRTILDGTDENSDTLGRGTLDGRLNPKGFWRVDRDKDPELRHTVLTLVAFHDLKQMIEENGGDREKGIKAFCSMNDGEGWMLPETLCLADYGLGHDERAKKPQPVRERLGDRFLPWQLEATPEQSWKECEVHARNLLGEEGFKNLVKDISASRESKSRIETPYDYREAVDRGLGRVADAERRTPQPGEQAPLFGTDQRDLFGGQATYQIIQRRRRK